MRLLACILLAILALSSFAALNIYPDPSFEATGTPGVARTGERAAYLKVDAMNHWAAFGGQIAVEPFARYRVSEWVKGTVGKGNFYAPYVYEWDSFVWAFGAQNAMKSSDDWTHVQLTFISPHPYMQVHPLAYIDAANCEAWADDIVVQKITEPEDVIAEIKAKASPSADEQRILARWHVSQGDLAAATEVMRKTSGIVHADIARVIAAEIKDPAQRKPYVLAMIANGGPTYNWGIRRLNEITADMTAGEKLGLFEEAIVSNPGSEASVAAYRTALQSTLLGDSTGVVAEQEAALQATRDAVDRILGQLPDNSAARPKMQEVAALVDDMEQEIAERKAALGSCEVSIFGKVITPQTHAIVIPDEATPQEEHAARDLRHHLELITGQALPLVHDSERGDATPIFVGKCAGIKERIAVIDFESLGIEGIHIKTAGPALILAGNKRGVLYATYTFLEDYLGCRWFAPDCSTWPREGEIKISSIDKRYIPPLEYRSTDYPSSRPADFSVRNKYNGAQHQPDEARGGNISYRGFVHTFNALVPPERYFADHPEYYSEINGARVGPDHSQLCLTNPDVLRIATQTVRQWIKESPNASIISVSQNDWHNYCQCEKCSALAEKEGSQAGPLLHFVNAIAEDIEKDYPHIIIDTLAYQYTRKPPLHVKPRPNVAIRLCSIECCFIHPLETDPFNKTFVDDIRGWNEICDRLHIWDYVINYAHSIMPFPNLYVLKPNIQFFINNGVTGIYEEACYYTKGSELQELRSYVMAKLLWDPSYDTDKAIDEFCAAYYGAAAPFVREYINVIHQSAQSIPDMHVRIYSPPTAGYLTPEVIEKSVALFDKAEAAVQDDAKLLHRVQVARLPIMYTQIALGTEASFAEKDGALVQQAGTDPGDLVARFEKIARAEGITRVREGGPQASLDAWLEARPKQGRKLDLETLQSGDLKVSVIPGLGGRIWSATYKGRELLRKVGEPGAWVPDEGGYEEYTESGYRSPGWFEQYRVTAKSERSITLEANLKNGLRVSRTIELAADKPSVRIRTTATNPEGAARSAALRVHPEYAVTSTANCEVRLLGADGKWATIDCANPADPLAEKEQWLTTDNVRGAWAMVDKGADIALVNRFDTDQVERLLLNHSGSKSRVNLELFGKQTSLNAGESAALEHTLEIVPAGSL